MGGGGLGGTHELDPQCLMAQKQRNLSPQPHTPHAKGYVALFSKFTLILKFCKNLFPRILIQSIGKEAVLEGLPLRPMIYNNPGSGGAEREKEKCPSNPPSQGPGGSTPLQKQGFWPVWMPGNRLCWPEGVTVALGVKAGGTGEPPL